MGTRNKVFYSLFIRGDYVEYHTSADKEESEQGHAMNRQIKTDNPNAPMKILEWIADAEFYHCEKVKYKGLLK